MNAKQPLLVLSFTFGVWIVLASCGPVKKAKADAAQSTGRPPLAQMVADGKGTIPISIRQDVRDEDNILALYWPPVPEDYPQHYTTLYSFGTRTLSTQDFATLIKFKPDMVLSLEEGPDDSIPHVAMGTTFHVMPHITLAVTDVTPGFFTLTDPSHKNEGSITYGAFRDSTDELWLFEECVGSYFTSPTYIGLHQEKLISTTHNVIEAAITYFIGNDGTSSDGSSSEGSSSEPPCPGEYSSNYVYGVNNRVETDISVQPGDRLTFRASGVVTLGIFAGQSGPEGIQFNPAYSYFPDSPHGCLIGRIRTSEDEDAGQWAYIGKGDVWTVKDAGTLELDLNDNDPGNNTGEYRVEIDLCRSH